MIKYENYLITGKVKAFGLCINALKEMWKKV